MQTVTHRAPAGGHRHLVVLLGCVMFLCAGALAALSLELAPLLASGGS